MIATIVSILAVIVAVAALALNLRTLYLDIWDEIESALVADWRYAEGR